MSAVKHSPQSSSVSNCEYKSKSTAKIQPGPWLARMAIRMNNNDVPHHNRQPTCQCCRECFSEIVDDVSGDMYRGTFSPSVQIH